MQDGPVSNCWAKLQKVIGAFAVPILATLLLHPTNAGRIWMGVWHLRPSQK